MNLFTLVTTIAAGLAGAASAADFDAALMAPVQAYETAVNAGDIAGIKAVFTPDAVLMAQNAMPVDGDAVIASYQGLFGALDLDIDFTFEETTDLGNGWAIVRTRSGGGVTVKANDADLPNANQELFVLQDIDGTWKIARYIYATTAPMQ
ncbi:YybH family protein [Marinibacterium sp. SX1]|uniref:YybH family protein n=1 Tax=Marinibacterium sp. SX1 TaxID=3388424 RepID=UPI003D17CD08